MRSSILALFTVFACVACYQSSEAVASCPDEPPVDDEPCDGALGCSWLRCEGAGAIVATCNGERWTVSASPCPIDCGETLCEDGEICQRLEGGALFENCADDPCDGDALEECACSVCPNPEACLVTGFTVHCNTCASDICP